MNESGNEAGSVTVALPDRDRVDKAVAWDSMIAAGAEVMRLRAALAPFAGDKLPSARRTKIAYDRYGLRRCISPLELARDDAFRALQHPKETP